MVEVPLGHPCTLVLGPAHTWWAPSPLQLPSACNASIMKVETSEKPFQPNSIDQLNQPKQDTKHLIIHHLRVQNMKTQQTRSMCTTILNWDQVLRKHFTWVDSAGFGVAHLRMLHVDLKAKLTFPHWGQVQSPSPPRAPVRQIIYMRLQRKICNSGFEATHSVSSQKTKSNTTGMSKNHTTQKPWNIIHKEIDCFLQVVTLGLHHAAELNFLLLSKII